MQSSDPQGSSTTLSSVLLPLVAFSVPAYRPFWSAVLAQYAGFWLLLVTRGFLVYELTGSSAALGAVSLAEALGMLAMMPLGGLLADRYPRATIARAGHWSLTLLAAAHLALLLAGALGFWPLTIGALLHGGILVLLISARQALTGAVVDASIIGNAMALQEVAFNLARIGAPAAAGAVLASALLGPRVAFALLVAVFALSALLLQIARFDESAEHPDAGDEDGAGPGLAHAVRYLRRRPALLLVMLLGYLLGVGVLPYMQFMPAFVGGVFGRGAFELGLITTATAGGALVASVAAAAFADRDGAWRAAVALGAIFPLTLALLAVAPSFGIALLIAALLGAVETIFISLKFVIFLRFAPVRLHGRMQALTTLTFSIAGVAALPLGVIADVIGLRETLVASALVVFVAALLLIETGRRAGAPADARPIAVPRRSTDAALVE